MYKCADSALPLRDEMRLDLVSPEQRAEKELDGQGRQFIEDSHRTAVAQLKAETEMSQTQNREKCISESAYCGQGKVPKGRALRILGNWPSLPSLSIDIDGQMSFIALLIDRVKGCLDSK